METQQSEENSQRSSMEEEMEKETGLGEFYGPDRAWRQTVLSTTRARVAELGRVSCLILVDFISEREDEDVSAIFGHFRACFVRMIRPHHTLVVLDRVFELLQTGERVFLDRDESRGKAEAPLARELSPAEKFTLFTVERLCEEIIFMEGMVKLVLSHIVTVTTIGKYIQDCWSSLKLIYEEVCCRLRYVSSLRDRSEMGGDEPLRRVMREKTIELWSTFKLYQN